MRAGTAPACEPRSAVGSLLQGDCYVFSAALRGVLIDVLVELENVSDDHDFCAPLLTGTSFLARQLFY
jgi:hypothetical protein